MEELMIKRDRKIVVAVDESEESMYALSWCLTNLLSNSNSNSASCCSSQSSDSDESESEPATLVLLYVKPPPPVYSEIDLTGYLFGSDVVGAMEEYSKELVDSVMVKTDEIFEKHNINVKVEKKVGNGDAKDVICKCVERLGADVLVMGSHDYGFFKRAFLGSVSEHCAKYAKCPVVVVKNPHCNDNHRSMHSN